MRIVTKHTTPKTGEQGDRPMDAADSAMGDNFLDHCLDYWDAREPSMLYGWGHDGSSRVSGGYHDSSSLDAGHSSPVASAVAASGRKNVVVTGRLRRGQRLNDKLHALRSVVPNITKMGKASIVKDAMEYLRHLQEQERQLLAELESAAPATHGQRGAPASHSCAHHVAPPMKKMRRFPSSLSAETAASTMAATSNRLEALEVRVTGAGDKVLLVSVACRHRKDAMAKVFLALDGIHLAIISANVTSTSGTLKYTALVERGEIHPSEMKQVIETAIAQVDAAGSTLSSMSY